VFISSYRCIF